MRIWAIANQKGGVGKTTTSLAIAAELASRGSRVLLIDLDPHASLTCAFGVPADPQPRGVLELFDEDRPPLATLVRASEIPNLSYLPAQTGLAMLERRSASQPGLGLALSAALTREAGDYDYVLLDCPPSLGPLTVNALVAADRVIVPVQTEYFALEGLAGLLDTLALIQRELNPRLTVAGMILTMHDPRTRLAQDVEREVREHFPDLVFDTVIPRNIRVGEAPSFGVPVIRHDPRCSGSLAYAELAREVAARG